VTFRTLAALTLSLGAVALLGGLAVLGKGPGVPRELRALRAGKGRTAAPERYAAWTTDSFVALPHGRPLAAYAPLERKGVSLEGWVQRTMLAGDGDLHLEIVPTPRASGGADTAYVTGEVTPQWRRPGGWTNESLVSLFRPNRGGVTPWEAGPRRVRVSGWLLYDHQYDRTPTSWSLRNQAPRLTGWEIHPVTRIEVWDEARGDGREVPA
jgi:hypothetical protein